MRLRSNHLLLVPVVFIGLGLRVYRPLLLPIFHDEALHLARAAQVGVSGSLVMGTEGGKYLQPWLVALIWPLTTEHLLAARLLAALVGVLGLLGVYLLTRALYRREGVAVLATALAALSPYLVFFDRMALADGLLTALVVWGMWLSLMVVRRGVWWHAAALGLMLGLTATAKLNGALYFAFPLLALVLDRPREEWRARLPHLALAWLLALPGLAPAALDLAPQTKSTLARSWINSQEKGISHLARWGYNAGVIGSTFWRYAGPAMILLSLGEAGFSLRRRERGSWLAAAATLLTVTFFFATAGYDKFYPRYLLPAFPFLIMLAARGICRLMEWMRTAASDRSWVAQAATAVLVVLTIAGGLVFDYRLLTDPPAADWLALDRWQYVDGWPAGYGVVDAAAFLRERAAGNGPLVLVKRATERMRTGAWAYYLDRPETVVQAVNFRHEDPRELLEQVRQAPLPVYVALDVPFEVDYAEDFATGVFASYVELVGSFPRPGGASRIDVYQVSVHGGRQ